MGIQTKLSKEITNEMIKMREISLRFKGSLFLQIKTEPKVRGISLHLIG